MDRLAELERRWSRFEPTSEVSRANEQAGAPVEVSDDTFLLCTLAEQAHRLTGGAFNPLLGNHLSALGYDRSFELIGSGHLHEEPQPDPSSGVAITCDEATRTVTIPHGHRFDPGGLGKGLAADLVVEELITHGAAGALVDLGGDVRVAGESPREGGWSIGIEDPHTPGRELLRVGLSDGAVASSSRLRRCWSHHGESVHHVLDPHGKPLRNGIAAVSVLADRGWRAEMITKHAFVAGSDEGLAVLDQHDVDGVIVRDDGTQVRTKALLHRAA